MRYCWLVLTCLLGIPLQAQFQVHGQVVDSQTQEALVGANVYLFQNWRIGTSTDANGKFSLLVPVEVSNDSLVVSYVGYQEKLLSIQQQVAIALDPQATLWEEVVIKAEPLIAEEFKYLKINNLQSY